MPRLIAAFLLLAAGLLAQPRIEFERYQLRKYAQPDQAVFLLVGDPEKIGAIDGLIVLK